MADPMTDPVEDPMLDLSGLAYRWPGSGFGIDVPRLTIPRGQSLFLHGPSGSGKSTLLSLICGILAPDRGAVRLDGRDLATLGARARDRARADGIGVIFQMFNLIPYLSGEANILLPLRFAPARRANCPDPQAQARRLADELGLDPQVLAIPAARLSVGQQQRIAVARAMIGQPPLIVADEPTSALDAQAQAGFVDLLFDQVAQAGATLLLVSHDDRLAPRFDRQLALPDIARITRGAV
ncbi:MAG: ATP-binding cassette domain-containing protein [Marinibacterium sp.]|nr:ATP-binding cassette domain-containing protein [Marinibacterium sp.]